MPDRVPPIRWMFCENNTNNERIFGTDNVTRYVKDGINNAIVGGDDSAVSTEFGSKAAAVAVASIRRRLVDDDHRFSPRELSDLFADADTIPRGAS